MRRYFLSAVILLLLAAIGVFCTKCSSSSNAGNDDRPTYFVTKNSTNEVETKGKSEGKQKIDVDIPLALKNTPEQILVRKRYVVSYNKETKLPNWVAWRLSAEHVNGEVKRPNNAWHEDTDVPSRRATTSDYKGSGWTRGHMCPAGDNKWDSEAMYESFLYTNCCPQNGNLNNGTWNQIELACRRWVERYGSVQIVCGPVFYNQEHATIGENKVVVPEAFFKVILCLDGTHPKGIGFVCKNSAGNGKKDLYVNSIKQVERITGMTFFPHLPKEVADIVKSEANLDEW